MWAASGASSPLGDLLVAQLQLRLQIVLWEERKEVNPQGTQERRGEGEGTGPSRRGGGAEGKVGDGQSSTGRGKLGPGPQGTGLRRS